MAAKRILTAAMSLLLMVGVLAVPVNTSAQTAVAAATHLFWTRWENFDVSRATVAGTDVVSFTPPAVGSEPINKAEGGSISVAGAYFYWTTETIGIGRGRIDGTEMNPEFLKPDGNLSQVLATTQYIYWTAWGDSIGRANIDGTNPNPNFITGLGDSEDMATDGTYLYWTSPSRKNIGRSKLDGTEVNPAFIALTARPYGITVTSTHIFWGEYYNSQIGRANIDGTGQQSAFLTTEGSPDGLVADGSYLYWTSGATGAIGRANLDGSNVNNTFISETVADAWWGIAVAILPPANTVAPTVSGTAKVDATLTAANGTWSGAPTYAYQWLRCTGTGVASDTLPAGCTTISGATQGTYAIDDADYQKYLRVRVTGTNGGGNDVKYSATTAKVAASATENRSAPTISGSATINATLTGNKGSWAGYPAPTYTYQWLRCTRAGSASDALPSGCSTISGATRTTHKLTTTDYGTYLRLKVVGTNSLGSDTKYSAATAKIAGTDPVNTVAPRITGTASVGATVTGTEGTWTGFPDPTSTYQWFRCTSAGSASTAQPSGCTAISGATRSTYKLVAADKTSGYLRVRVTGTSAEGRAVRFSAAVKVN